MHYYYYYLYVRDVKRYFLKFFYALLSALTAAPIGFIPLDNLTDIRQCIRVYTGGYNHIQWDAHVDGWIRDSREVQDYCGDIADNASAAANAVTGECDA